MSKKTLHIISFTIPYPANYGGVIDVFYKLKALHEQGLDIIFHCFEYQNKRTEELNKYCKEVYYYKRSTGRKSNLSFLPYVVYSRKNDALLQNLLKDQHPVFFEGIQTCYYLNHPELKNRIKIYRSNNIEHQYYFHLFKANIFRPSSLFFLIESLRLWLFQKQLKGADKMVVVSQNDQLYLQRKFPNNEIIFLPSFYDDAGISEQQCLEKDEGYVLYHGNLSVIENEKAALFLIKKVFSKLNNKCIIAGLNPSKQIQEIVKKYSNISLIASPNAETMEQLIKNAHQHILYTFQATGLKLKLLNVLKKGRFCIVNHKMVTGSGLESLCEIADTPAEIIEKINFLFTQKYTYDKVTQRDELLKLYFSNKVNAQKIINCIFED